MEDGLKPLVKNLLIIGLIALFIVDNAASQCSSNILINGNGPGTLGDAQWGEMISGIGDLDDDGLPDIIIARKTSFFSTAGGVFAYSGLTGDSIRTLFEGTKVFAMSLFGDFNNDGYDDVLVNGQVYSGADGAMLADYYDVARDGVAIGDLNSDGKYDIIIGNDSWKSGLKNNVGRVDVLSGLNGDTIRSWEGVSADYRFGELFSSAGDFNSDNIPDILVGMPHGDKYGLSNRGQIFVLSGASSMDTLFSRLGSASNAEFGQMVVPLGNINGDSYDDIAALEEVNGSLVVRIWSGGLAPNQQLLYTLSEPDGAVNWPSSLSNAGDINGDGRNDIITGDYNYSNNKGRLHLYSGIDAAVLFNDYDRYGDPVAFGYTVAGVGDLDGDGNADFVAAAPAIRDSVENVIGGVYIYHCFYPNDECLADIDTDEDGLGNLCDNCIFGANPNQEDTNNNGIGDACEDSRTLPVNVDVFTTLSAGGQSVSMHFDAISTAGTVELTVTENGPAADASFELVPNTPPLYFNIITDATYTGLISISTNYDATGMSSKDEALVSLYHFNNGKWVDITTERNPDFDNVKGETTSLSPFVIGQLLSCCGQYSAGYTGNTDCDVDGKHNLSDITTLIDRIFLSKMPLCCEENGNVNGDIEAKMNLSDITSLIDHIFLAKGPSAPCQ